MARAPRVLKAAVIEGAPAEPDMLDDIPPPREANALFGHEEETARLAAAFRSAPPQGIILTGPQGIGKATLAFRIAKALLSGAEITDRFDSDAESRDVAQVSAGTHPSLLHLTRAYDEKAKRFRTELTVDTVRRIVPFLGSSAAGNGWRVVIVDAVDDMNANAANALLKGLEEPPRRTVFLLIAHVAGRVLPTIRSRCRMIRLRPLGLEPLKAALTHLDADPAAADVAEGSVRRALSLSADGADAVRSARRILGGSLADSRRRFELADLAAQRRGENFAAVADLTLDALSARIRKAAGRAPLETLDLYARAYLDALAERRRVEIFNLDRKEFMLALAGRIADADSRVRAA